MCFSILSVIPPMKGKFEQAVEEYTSCFQEKSLLTSAFGGFILGIGMALSGSVSVILTSAFGGFFLRVGMALSGSVSVISNK